MAKSFWSRAGGFLSDLFKKKIEDEGITVVEDFIKGMNSPSFISYTSETGKKSKPVTETLVLTNNDRKLLLKEVQYIKDKYLKYNYNIDDVPNAVLRWKTHKYPNWKAYSYDSENYNKTEYWASPYETLLKGKGDCDDWGIVMYHLMRLLGVPEHRLRCVAGDVKYIDGNPGGGHFYCIYFSVRWNDWVVVETTWYDDLSLVEYPKGIIWKDHPRYGRHWFSFNESGAFSSSTIFKVKKGIFKKV